MYRSSIPSLQIPLSNASSAVLRPPSHGSGPEWFATPSLCDSFIRDFVPVYPGAVRYTSPMPPAPIGERIVRSEAHGGRQRLDALQGSTQFIASALNAG